MDIRKGFKDDFLTSLCRYYDHNRLLGKTDYGIKLRNRLGNTKDFYGKIKSLFYDNVSHKWQVSKGISYVRNKKIDPVNLTSFLKDFRLLYLRSNNTIYELKQFLYFIENLETNTKLREERFFSNNIRLVWKEDVDIFKFLDAFYQVANLLETKDSLIIQMIFYNFETNLELSTLRRLYYDNKPKKQKKN